jgi:hypothetical protein
MKWIIVILLIFQGHSIFSQKEKQQFTYQAGITVGINISTVEQPVALTFTNLGISTGLKGVLELPRQFEIHHYLTYSQKGYQWDENIQPTPGIEPNDVYTWDYLDLPLMIGYQFDQKPFSFTPMVGVQQGWMLRAYRFEHEYLPGRIIRNGTNLLEDPSQSINRYEIGWLIGISIMYPSQGKLTPFLDIRYTQATNQISGGHDAALRGSNRMLTFNAGIYF